ILGDPHFNTDFNLDSDRGYGYQCWGWNRDEPPKMHQGYRGRSFAAPVTWPEAAGNLDSSLKWVDDSKVLQLHYKNRPDPHRADAQPRDQGCGRTSLMPVRVEPASIRVGSATQVTVRAEDQQTHQPVAGVVTIDGLDVAETNAPFKYIFRSTKAAGTVSAVGYP